MSYKVCGNARTIQSTQGIPYKKRRLGINDALNRDKMAIKFMRAFYAVLRVSLEILSRVVFGLKYWGTKSTPLPPISNLLLMEPATDLAQKIRSRKVTSEEVVKAFIARIKEVNPILNAVVDNNFTKSLEEARKVDEYLRSSDISESELAESKPFLGVPFSTKDCFCVKGYRHTAGLLARKDFIADKDADVICLMKNAGAIMLAVTNVSELCMWWESSNTVYGRTNNPYDTRRIVGGSSGGEGCNLSACGSPMGVGSDIGGSIRMPSFFNGIFGHKPSSGIVSNDGQEPVAVGELQDFLVTGPMCRFVKDLIPMYKVLAASNVHLLQLDKKVNLNDLKIYYMEDDGGNPAITPVERELKLAQSKVLEHFKRAYKITPTKIHIRQFVDGVRIYFAKLGGVPEAKSFSSELNLKKGEISAWKELVKCIFGMSVHTVPALLLAVFEKMGEDKQSAVTSRLLHSCEKMKKELTTILGDDGIFLYPSHPTVAPYHSQPIFRPWNFSYTSILNIIGVPVTQCPLGLGSQGLPLGIQVVANKYQDHLCIAVAAELEKVFGGWVCPSVVQ